MTEVLISLALLAFLSVLGIKVLLNSTKDIWPRVVEDYTRQLSAAYNKIRLDTGETPLRAIDNNTINNPTPTPLYEDGIATLLQTWETTTRYISTSPARLQYPSGMTVYVNPEDTNIPDPNSELPIHQAGALTPDIPPGNDASPQTIMAGTSDREWLLIDMSGTDSSGNDKSPNSLKPDGDRVLLMVDDATGRVLTAWQKCWLMNNPSTTTNVISNPYGSGTTCTMGPPKFAAPSRTYYKSFFDVYKKYTGAWI
jgi:type II secretory pathway pseudopilin PulG